MIFDIGDSVHVAEMFHEGDKRGFIVMRERINKNMPTSSFDIVSHRNIIKCMGRNVVFGRFIYEIVSRRVLLVEKYEF